MWLNMPKIERFDELRRSKGWRGCGEQDHVVTEILYRQTTRTEETSSSQRKTKKSILQAIILRPIYPVFTQHDL